MTTATQGTDEEQKDFGLKDEAGNTLTLSGHHWHVTSIEVSPVCIAVQVEHKSGESTTDSDWHEVQNELFGFLKGISNLAADRNIMHPMIGFVTAGAEEDEIKQKELKSKVLSWSADQDWHQGNFILYVTGDSSDEMPKKDELLSEHPNVLESNLYQRPKAKDLINNISSKTKMNNEEKEVFDQVFDLMEHRFHREYFRDNFRDELYQWKEGLITRIKTEVEDDADNSKDKRAQSYKF